MTDNSEPELLSCEDCNCGNASDCCGYSESVDLLAKLQQSIDNARGESKNK